MKTLDAITLYVYKHQGDHMNIGSTFKEDIIFVMKRATIEKERCLQF